MNDEKAKDDSLDSWVERITAAVRYTGTGDHEDVRSILHDFANRSATDNSNPHPVTAQVCGVCGELWAAHERMANTWNDEDGGGERKEPITVEFCLYLLKNRFTGPPDPVWDRWE